MGSLSDCETSFQHEDSRFLLAISAHKLPHEKFAHTTIDEEHVHVVTIGF